MKLERQRDNQSWMLDWMVKETGRTHNFAYGRELPREVKSYKMIPRIMERYGRHAEELARAAEGAGHRETALELYARAMHPYHIGQHSIYEDDNQEKIYLHSAWVEKHFLAPVSHPMLNIQRPLRTHCSHSAKHC